MQIQNSNSPSKQLLSSSARGHFTSPQFYFECIYYSYLVLIIIYYYLLFIIIYYLLFIMIIVVVIYEAFVCKAPGWFIEWLSSSFPSFSVITRKRKTRIQIFCRLELLFKNYNFHYYFRRDL